MGYSIGYEAKSLGVLAGIDLLEAGRRAERFVMPDNCRITGIWR